MNCTEARVRLPLLLSRDLPTDEAGAVRKHLAACSACRSEWTAVAELHRLLDSVPVPAGGAVDLPRLYREAAELQGHRLRRWRRIAGAALAAAAAILLGVFLSRVELRIDANQLVLRWGTVPPPEEPVPPAPVPPREPPIVSPAVASTADIEQQLRLLSELVQTLSSEADGRDERRQQEIVRLRMRMEGLQHQITELRVATERDVSALYAAQSTEKEKGTQP